MVTRVSLTEALRRLRKFYGKPPRPNSTDPFRLILWEQVAYLAPDSRRRAAYAALRDRVGLSPAAILATSDATLQQVTRLGGSIAAVERAARMRRSAELVLESDRTLKASLRLPLPEARRALAAFPMIGEPGADKIMVFTKSARLLPLDSNGLRVLERLGIAPGGRDYRAAYRGAQAAVHAKLPKTHAALIDAYHLLREHGQELCRRSAPRCVACPLRAQCPVGAARN
jgi:endonuclease-3